MATCLRLALLASLTSFASSHVGVQSYGRGVRSAVLDGSVSNEHLLFQATVYTKIACASACLKYKCCVAFSTSPKRPPSVTLTCRGHYSMSAWRNSTVNVLGSKTYFVRQKPRDSSWLKRSCEDTNDCPSDVANVVCFGTAGHCLCQPGYYYSLCRDACVSDCASQDLQPSFVNYPGLNINKHNIENIGNCSTFKGKLYCLANSRCRSFEIKRATSTCQLQEVTLLQPDITVSTGHQYDHYQRTCL